MKRINKAVSLLLVAAMLCGMMITSAFATSGTWAGSGTESDPYQIADAADLTTLATNVNHGTNYEGKYFEMTADITAASDWAGARGDFVQVETSTNSPAVSGTGFAGIFDGNGKTLTVNVNTDESYIGGLFGYLEPIGVLKNLTVTGTLSSTGGEEANAVGGVVGYNSGIIDNVTSSVQVSASSVYNVGGIAGFNDNYYSVGAIGTIRNCVNSGNVSGMEKVGGITGENSGLIAACGNTGTISTNSDRKAGVGGIAGRNGNNDTAAEKGTIYSCYNTGTIAVNNGSWGGGIAGFQNTLSSISYSYSAGELTNTNADDAFVDTGYITGDTSGKLTVCYAQNRGYEGMVDDVEDSGNNIPAIIEIVTESDLKNQSTVDKLNSGDSAYGKWTLPENDTTNNGYPIVSEATATATSTTKPVAKTVYLDGTVTTSGTGTPDSPFNTLKAAAAAAGSGGTVIVDGTVTITEGSYYDSVKIVRGACTGPMFIINAPDNEYGIAYVTMTSAEIDGGFGDVFSVVQGRLRLRGNIEINNANVAVNVSSSGQLEINYAKIDAATAVKVAGADNEFILDSFGTNDISISGTISLGTGSYIEVKDTLSGALLVECTQPAPGVKVAEGSDAAGKIFYVDGLYSVTSSGTDLVLAAPTTTSATVYLNGTGNNGDGSAASPFNYLALAIAAAGNGGTINVTDKVNLKYDAIYDANVTINGDSSVSTMFVVNNTNAVVEVGALTVNGNGSSLIFDVDGGNLRLYDYVMLQNANSCVSIFNGAFLEVNDASITGESFCVQAGTYEDTFILNSNGNTFLNGDIMLGSAYITIANPIPCALNIMSLSTVPGTVIAQGTDNYKLGFEDLEQITVINATVDLDMDNQIIII